MVSNHGGGPMRSSQLEPPHQMGTLIVRIRDIGQPFGTGQGIKFSGDELDGNDPEHVTALDQLANWIVTTLDNTGSLK